MARARALAAGAKRHRRSLAERLAVLFPAVGRRLVSSIGRAWQILPRRSRLRRRLAQFAVDRSYAAFNRRDLDLLGVLFHPNCTMDMSQIPNWADEPAYHGHEGLRQYFSDWYDVWGEVEYVPRAITDLGNVILVDGQMRTVGEASGIELERTYTQVAESRNGMTWRITHYWDREQALRAVGLHD